MKKALIALFLAAVLIFGAFLLFQNKDNSHKDRLGLTIKNAEETDEGVIFNRIVSNEGSEDIIF